MGPIVKYTQAFGPVVFLSSMCSQTTCFCSIVTSVKHSIQNGSCFRRRNLCLVCFNQTLVDLSSMQSFGADENSGED